MAPPDAAQPSTLDEAQQKYDELRANLKEGLARKRQVDHELTDLESQIYLYEGSYLNNTALSGGNVIRGFDSYLKANATATSGMRLPAPPAPSADDRMFSTSSTTYQRSLALKVNEAAAAPEAVAAAAEDSKNTTTGTAVHKLKRKG